MEEHKLTRSELHDLASSYALGALDDPERVLFEDHLRGCNICTIELRSFADVTDALATSVSENPPASLKQRLMAKVQDAPRIPGILFDQGGLLIARSAELAWRPLAPGIVFKPLYVDTARAYGTLLVRMDAGARYTSHRHTDIEELFLLTGDPGK